MNVHPPTLDYRSTPAPVGEELIAEHSAAGVTIRLPPGPLWKEILQTSGALTVSLGAVAFIGAQTWSAAARGAAALQWGGRVVVGLWCALLVLASLQSAQRLRRRLRGEPVADTVFLPAADQPGGHVTAVRVVDGPVKRKQGRAVRLRISFTDRDALELDVPGSADDAGRTAAELRRALRLAVPDAPARPYTA